MGYIVTIEENQEDANLIKELFTGTAHKLIIIQFSEIDEEYVKSSKPDIVLIAISEKAHLDFVRRIKQNPAFKEVPIIGITNKSNDKFIQAHKRIGFVDYIIKPVDRYILLNKANFHLNESSNKVFKVKPIVVERSIKKSNIILNADIKKSVIPEIKKVFTPQLMKAMQFDTICFDLRNLPTLSSEEIVILDKIIQLLFKNRRVAVIAGRHLGFIVSESNLQESVDLFMTDKEYEDFQKTSKNPPKK